MEETLVRALWALGIVLLGLATFWAANRFLLWRLRKRPLGLEGWRAGTPAVLYFTTPDCQPCKTQQQPALSRLVEKLAVRVQVIQVDATEKPKLADYWGVLSVPTTFIIDSQGQPRGVNHGVASAEKLRGQLEAAEGGRLLQAEKAAAELSSIADRERS